MTAHFSKWDLNTYAVTPYFHAHAPEDYPLKAVLRKCRAFRRLPPRLRELSSLAKKWACRVNPEDPAGIGGIEQWYDAEGYELDPGTGRRLTDAEIDAQWDALEARGGATDVEVKDIPEPPGGFADPDTWQEPPQPPDPDTDDPGITEDQLTRDIASHGREYVAKDYGVPPELAAHAATGRDLARLILARVRGTPSPPTLPPS